MTAPGTTPAPALRDRARDWAGTMRGGVLLAATIAFAASFVGEHYGAPAMLFALLLGMAFNFLSADPRAAPGIGFASGTLLRFGVALLGLRLTFEDVAELGWTPVLGVALLLVLTVLGGVVIARFLGRPAAFGLLAGGAVGICGASAALAIAAVLPKRRIGEEDVLLTVVGVTALSTMAMVLYPAIFGALGLDEVQIGFLIGATIHDVAQVVGAGFSVGETAGDIATFTKLQRVALLPVVLVAVGLATRETGGARFGLPRFVVAFTLLMLLRNLAPLPEVMLLAAGEVSRFLLLTAIAALGVKTALAQLFAGGPRRMLIIALDTALLLCLALAFLFFFMR